MSTFIVILAVALLAVLIGGIGFLVWSAIHSEAEVAAADELARPAPIA